MSNKGALAVTNLLDNVKGISKLITNKKVIDINHLESGVYFMNIKVDNITYIRKVIKQ